jgi:hypothetical protein
VPAAHGLCGVISGCVRTADIPDYPAFIDLDHYIKALRVGSTALTVPTRTMLLSSSTSPSPSRSAVACGRSSRKVVPPSPLPVAGIKHDTIDGFSRVPLARNFDFGGALHSRCQNKKYLCAIGSTSAGAQVSSSPLAVTS